MFGWVGCGLCINGSVTIVLHAPVERPLRSVGEVWAMAMQPGEQRGQGLWRRAAAAGRKSSRQPARCGAAAQLPRAAAPPQPLLLLVSTVHGPCQRHRNPPIKAPPSH
jgi:hypothetical protein